MRGMEQVKLMSRTGHLSVRRGKRVLVHLHSGDSYVAKFKERLAKTVQFYDHPPESTNNIRTLSIYKEES